MPRKKRAPQKGPVCVCDTCRRPRSVKSLLAPATFNWYPNGNRQLILRYLNPPNPFVALLCSPHDYGDPPPFRGKDYSGMS